MLKIGRNSFRGIFIEYATRCNSSIFRDQPLIYLFSVYLIFVRSNFSTKKHWFNPAATWDEQHFFHPFWCTKGNYHCHCAGTDSFWIKRSLNFFFENCNTTHKLFCVVLYTIRWCILFSCKWRARENTLHCRDLWLILQKTMILSSRWESFFFPACDLSSLLIILRITFNDPATAIGWP